MPASAIKSQDGKWGVSEEKSVSIDVTPRVIHSLSLPRTFLFVENNCYIDGSLGESCASRWKNCCNPLRPPFSLLPTDRARTSWEAIRYPRRRFLSKEQWALNHTINHLARFRWRWPWLLRVRRSADLPVCHHCYCHPAILSLCLPQGDVSVNNPQKFSLFSFKTFPDNQYHFFCK